MIRLLSAAVLAASLGACAPTQTTYGPAGPGDRAVGYDSIRIEDDRWRVSFTAGPDAGPAALERYALRRAAELTLEAGYDWFEIVGRDMTRSGYRDSPVGVGGSVGGTIGSGGYRSSGVGIGINLSPGQERRETLTLEIIAGSGEDRPELAYDARQVLAGMGGAPAY
ncbi:hypothetical protein E5163_01080 [Marinicauda algicola]|uniref:Lipoprotein n=1 Tax=Marinicauda algicola TaxID=2029849 RepID=A0A4S2H2E8_9PROT|nr:hypothetical protein [Marinicauda algicola]TGY89765.1 hypothetical protein E5163_01080 [Marinicauda algicola]